MKAALWDSIDHISIVEKPMPVADAGHVVVKVKAVGVCATDVHMITGKVSLAKPPHVLGHEIAGEVEEVGLGVTGWKKGDRVVIDTIISCGRCKACKSGRKELCHEKQEIGYDPYDGGYAEYVRVPAQCLVHLPEEIPFRDAAILESIACPFGAVLRVGIKLGSTVLIQGGGPAGIAFLQAAKLSGAGKVIMSAKGENRLAYAKKFGADHVIDAKNEDVLARVMELTNGEGCDYVLEASGSEAGILLSFDACKVGGDVLCYGIPDEKAQIPFPFMKMLIKQLRIHGILEYCAGWDTLVTLVANGKINVHDIVTHTFSLDELPKAVELVKNKEKGLLKAVIEM
ncbi:MAG: alcohol dehydrogenase catalytic domain-containing protein [Clostridia bacterium]|nr:alcohol dehydrogenase catalytic domain-containing protein [Clostridia bacterium]